MISGVGGVLLFKGGAGTLALSGANTATSTALSLTGGTLQIGTLCEHRFGRRRDQRSDQWHAEHAGTSSMPTPAASRHISNEGNVFCTNSTSAACARAITSNWNVNFRDTATAGGATITAIMASCFGEATLRWQRRPSPTTSTRPSAAPSAAGNARLSPTTDSYISMAPVTPECLNYQHGDRGFRRFLPLDRRRRRRQAHGRFDRGRRHPRSRIE